MDLTEVLNVTEPVSVTFMEREFTAHVYTTGPERFTVEEREAVLPSDQEAQEDGAERKMEYGESIRYLRRALPVITSGIDMDGEPLTVKSEVFPACVGLLPDKLLIDLGNVALEKWNAKNPTSGEQSQNGSQPEDKLEVSQAATTSP